MKKGFYYIVSIITVSLLWSCSTQKNTKASRFYHSFTTRYNIYFNGKTSFDEALQAMNNGYKENYSEMIHQYPISARPKDKSDPGGPFDRAIEKSNKAIKLHSIQTKPLKKPGWRNNPKQVAIQAKEEYNPFLKNSWLMLGQAQFYNADFLQAAATFSYISRHYTDDEIVSSEAKIWQARCYAEMEWFYESEDVLKKLNINGIPKKNLNLYAAINANYLIKEGRFEEAIPYLQTAIKAEKNRKQRTRMKYLLGQIYTDLGLDNLAYTMFGQVIKAYPPYELEFAARIRQTEVFHGNYQTAVKKLERMAKAEKNKEMLDQVYYALGNVYLNRQDTLNAIKNYHLGIEKSTQNGLDKAICQIRLGDIYFSMRDYINAQPCFSGALAGIQKEHKEYKRITKTSEILDELVIHVEAVQLQDSLQNLARMPEAERLAVIDKIIEKVKKEEEEAKKEAAKEAYLAEQAGNIQDINLPGGNININMPLAPGESSFYFYNSQTVAQGKTQFQRVWGRRTLEDNWRRRNKTMTTFDDIQDNNSLVTETDTTNKSPVEDPDNFDLGNEISSDPKTREYYLQQLPLTPEDVEASNIIIVDGLYHSAMIFKDKLEDFPYSIENFETLDRRFPNNEHRLESYYQVYLMALRMGDNVLANEYKNKLINTFPESDYAVAIANPNYEYNIRRMDSVQDSIYQNTYQYYLDGNIQEVRQDHQLMTEQYPLAKLMPKFMFLDALTYVETGDVEGFKEALKTLLDKYPQADVSELAGEMLKGVLRGRALVQGSVRGMAWNLRFGAEDGELSEADAAREFSATTNTPYRMLLVYPTGSLDKNQLLFTVAAYNFANFIVKEFDLTQEESGPISILNISGFINFEEILQYYRMIYGKSGYATALSKEVIVLPISANNYEVLMKGKTIEEYIDFFEEHFSELAPDIMVRWTAHHEADMQAEEEEEKKDSIFTPILVPDSIPTQEIEKVTPDTIPAVQTPEENLGLTLKEIEEIRKQEAEETAVRKEEERKIKEEQERQEQELKEQQAQEREVLLKKQREEEDNKLKAKAEREKQQAREREAKRKQAEADRKAKEKTQRELLKQKEKEYKERLKQRETARKQKEQEYKKKLQEREKAQREARKTKGTSSRTR